MFLPFTEEKDKKSLSVAMKLLYLDAIVTDEGKQRLNELKKNINTVIFK